MNTRKKSGPKSEQQGMELDGPNYACFERYMDQPEDNTEDLRLQKKIKTLQDEIKTNVLIMIDVCNSYLRKRAAKAEVDDSDKLDPSFEKYFPEEPVIYFKKNLIIAQVLESLYDIYSNPYNEIIRRHYKFLKSVYFSDLILVPDTSNDFYKLFACINKNLNHLPYKDSKVNYWLMHDKKMQDRINRFAFFDNKYFKEPPSYFPSWENDPIEVIDITPKSPVLNKIAVKIKSSVTSVVNFFRKKDPVVDEIPLVEFPAHKFYKQNRPMN